MLAKIAVFFIYLGLFFTSGCSVMNGFIPAKDEDVFFQERGSMIRSSYQAGNDILSLLKNRIPEDGGILLTTFVNLDDLGETSTLGRTIPQQIGNRLIQCGYRVIDIRLRRGSLLVKEKEGEFALTRSIADLAGDNETYAILTGTYSVVYNRIHVNARVLKSTSGQALASIDYTLPYDLKALNPEGFSGARVGNQHFLPNVDTRLD
ncbi:MAG: FlgO family outer membrane protein [Desulfonatronovibrionaceae bacterium]